MEIGKIISVGIAIVSVAGVAVIVGSPYTAGIITATGTTFANAVSAAK